MISIPLTVMRVWVMVIWK